MRPYTISTGIDYSVRAVPALQHCVSPDCPGFSQTPGIPSCGSSNTMKVSHAGGFVKKGRAIPSPVRGNPPAHAAASPAKVDAREVRAPTRVDRRFGDLFGATSVCSGSCCKRPLAAEIDLSQKSSCSKNQALYMGNHHSRSLCNSSCNHRCNNHRRRRGGIAGGEPAGVAVEALFATPAPGYILAVNHHLFDALAFSRMR